MTSPKEPREWPVNPEGFLLIEDHSEDGEWSGHAFSYDPRRASLALASADVHAVVLKSHHDAVLASIEADKSRLISALNWIYQNTCDYQIEQKAREVINIVK